jgi:DNA gyrase subunit A
MVVTRNGKALRFHEQNVRPMGRTAAGVMAMRLLGDDEIVGLEVVKPDSDLLVLHERGWGKRTSLDEFNEKGRYTQGNWATDHRRLDEIGKIVAARVVKPNDQITAMTSNGLVLRTNVAEISRMGRSTRGVRIVDLQDGDSVAALAVLTYEDLTREVDGGSRDEDDERVALPVDALRAGMDSDLDDGDLDDSDLDEGDLDDGEFGDFDEAEPAMEGEDEE